MLDVFLVASIRHLCIWYGSRVVLCNIPTRSMIVFYYNMSIYTRKYKAIIFSNYVRMNVGCTFAPCLPQLLIDINASALLSVPSMMEKVLDNGVATIDETRLLHERMVSLKIDADKDDEVAVVDHVYARINHMQSEQLRIELQQLRLDSSCVLNILCKFGCIFLHLNCIFWIGTILVLFSSGNKLALRRRLKAYHQRQRLLAHGEQQPQPAQHQRNKNATTRYYDHLVVIDFECTCEDRVYKYEHEIIEFPAILVDTQQKRVVSWHTRLSVVVGLVANVMNKCTFDFFSRSMNFMRTFDRRSNQH